MSRIKKTLTKDITADTVMSRLSFTKLAKKINPALPVARKTDKERMQANLALVRIQGRLNKELRTQGLCLKSRNFYSEFYVVSEVDAAKEVTRYYNEAATKAAYAAELQAGLKHQYSLDLEN